MSHKKTTVSLSTRARWRGALSDAYDEAVEFWLGEADPEKAAAFYRKTTFPLACERIRMGREGVPRLELLFVPVGTQPYAPILAILGNPSRSVALLETPETREYGLEVEEAVGADVGTWLHLRIDGTDVGGMARTMRDCFDACGLPGGRQVGADITGGRKTMTAAIAGVGSLFGWRLFYVRGVQERGKWGYAHHERIEELPNVLDQFGDLRRESAATLLRGGACLPAHRLYSQVAEESCASRLDRQWARFARGAHALRTGRFSVLSEEFPALGRLGIPVGAEARGLVAAARRSSGGDRRAARAAVLLVAAKARWAEDDPPAARALLEEAEMLLEVAENTGRAVESLKERMRRLRQDPRLLAWRRGMRELDEVLGRGLLRRQELAP